MYSFELLKPATLQDALAALRDEGAQPLSGGQSLLPSMKMRLNQPETLVSLTAIAQLRGMSLEDRQVRIGATTTHAEVARGMAQSYPALADLAGRIADPAVRNRGTIGGSLANNDPSACYPAGILGSKSIIETDRREIGCDDFFHGMFSTALEEGEIITGVRISFPNRAAYAKVVQPASRFSLAAVFVAQYDDEVRVAVTGASSDGVFRWKAAEQALAQSFRPEVIRDLPLPQNEMISDLHAGTEYRRHLVGITTQRAVEQALQQLHKPQ